MKDIARLIVSKHDNGQFNIQVFDKDGHPHVAVSSDGLIGALTLCVPEILSLEGQAA